MSDTDTDNEIELKQEFAVALLRWPDDPVRAAKSVVGEDVQRAVQMSIRWVRDPVVVAHKTEMLEEHGAEAFTMTKAELINKLAVISDEARDSKDKIAALRQIAEIRGFVEKPGTKVEINNAPQRVMIVRDTGDDAAWEKKLQAQQARLTDDAAETKH